MIHCCTTVYAPRTEHRREDIGNLEPTPGIEPGTSFLPRMCSAIGAMLAHRSGHGMAETEGVEPPQGCPSDCFQDSARRLSGGVSTVRSHQDSDLGPSTSEVDTLST